jgi:hypothetical protein
LRSPCRRWWSNGERTAAHNCANRFAEPNHIHPPSAAIEAIHKVLQRGGEHEMSSGLRVVFPSKIKPLKRCISSSNSSHVDTSGLVYCLAEREECSLSILQLRVQPHSSYVLGRAGPPVHSQTQGSHWKAPPRCHCSYRGHGPRRATPATVSRLPYGDSNPGRSQASTAIQTPAAGKGGKSVALSFEALIAEGCSIHPNPTDLPLRCEALRHSTGAHQTVPQGACQLCPLHKKRQ